jgi:hypothetical protein
MFDKYKLPNYGSYFIFVNHSYSVVENKKKCFSSLKVYFFKNILYLLFMEYDFQSMNYLFLSLTIRNVQ